MATAPDGWHVYGLCTGLLIAYPLGLALYNLYFHPLAKIPGPKLWAAFRFTYCRSLWNGTHVFDLYRFHQKYGDIVRVAPNEISVARGDGWSDVHRRRYGHKPFPKNPIWWGDLPGRTPSIVSTPNEADHVRMRRLLRYCFTPRAVSAQEPTIKLYVAKLVAKLEERCSNSPDAATTINIVDWYMFTTFDIVGDLGFGETFHCLDNSTYHPWVAEVFTYFKVGAQVVPIRFYSILFRLLMRMIPAKTLNASRANYNWGVAKTHRRLRSGSHRHDFMEEIMKRNKDFKVMSLPELENNMNILIVAGSETCGSVLSGTTNYLVKTPHALARLKDEIRSTFHSASDMTFSSLMTLPYLNAVIEEGLRVCPPNPSGLQHLVPEGGDTACGMWFPGGTHIGVHQWSLYRSPENFHRPDDFFPERWLPSAIDDPKSPFHNDNRAAVQSFSAGMWSCIGKYLGYAELRLILGNIMWHFDLELAEDGRNPDWTKQKSYAVVEKEPLDLRVESIRPISRIEP